MEAAFIMNALKRNKGNRSRTASELGIHKTTLFRKMKAFGIS
jgi:transcriptional regulator with PAS, ATPase and Fis domain